MYKMIEMTPITMVDTVGVRYLGWILENDVGMALAVGRIVVWVEAEAEVSTIKISSRDRKVPRQPPPKTAPPSTDSTSNWLAWLPRPIPLVPVPANACTEKMTIA